MASALNGSLFPPRWDSNEDASVLLDRVAAAENWNVPMLVPPRSEEETWQTLARTLALAKKGVREGAGAGAGNPAAASLLDLFAAYSSGDSAGFNRAASACSVIMARATQAPAPFDFDLPEGWTEVGRPATAGVFLYVDARAYGHRVTRIDVVEGTRSASVGVNHFVTPAAPVADVVNHWRFSEGLVPLTAEELAKMVRSVKVDGRDCPYVDIATAPGRQGEPQRFLSVLIPPEAATGGGKSGPVHGWEIALYGDPDLVAREKPAFERFVGSLRFGSPRALSRWFPAGDIPPEAPPYRTLAALIPDGPRVWCVYATGP